MHDEVVKNKCELEQEFPKFAHSITLQKYATPGIGIYFAYKVTTSVSILPWSVC